MNPILIAALYVVSALVVIPIVFALFKTQYQFLDVALAALAAGAASLIPTVGGPASLVAMVPVLLKLRLPLY